jgi:hypothetical protein
MSSLSNLLGWAETLISIDVSLSQFNVWERGIYSFICFLGGDDPPTMGNPPEEGG